MIPRFSPGSLGTRLKAVQAGDFLLTEASFLPNARLPRHDHELASLTLVINGSCIETIGNKPYQCVANTLIIKPAGEAHSNDYQREGLHCLLIEIEKSFEEISPAKETLNRVELLHGGVLPALARRVYKEFRLDDPVSKLAIEGLVLEMLAHAARSHCDNTQTHAPRWLVEARDFCHEHFSEQISLVALAHLVGIHPAHLARSFRKQYQCTVGEYLRRLRLDYATRELVKSEKSLAEIAVEAGFYDQSHFSNLFKLHTGITPSEYRRSLADSKDYRQVPDV